METIKENLVDMITKQPYNRLQYQRNWL